MKTTTKKRTKKPAVVSSFGQLPAPTEAQRHKAKYGDWDPAMVEEMAQALRALREGSGQ